MLIYGMFSLFAKSIRCALIFLLVFAAPAFAGDPGTAKGTSLGARSQDTRKLFTLAADATWQLNVRERFDASALAFHNGRLITVNDRDGALYTLNLQTNSVAELKRLNLFSRAALSRVSPRKTTRFDLEGIALDDAGNIYVSEEAQRLVFKSTLAGKNLEALAFDWSSVQKFISTDPNASLEGIAIIGDRLYLANERSTARILVIDLPSRKIIDSFFVDSQSFAFGGPHYSDLAAFDGHLFILNRNHRCIFEVDPETKRVLAEYSFAQMELAPGLAYKSDYPTGAMEGLAIDEDHFWLLTDNNGKARFQAPNDIRPTLFRCKRPTTSASR